MSNTTSSTAIHHHNNMIPVIVDRLLSASSGDDAERALQQLIQTVREDGSSSNNSNSSEVPILLLQDVALVECLVSLLHTQCTSSTSTSQAVVVEDGRLLVLELLQTIKDTTSHSYLLSHHLALVEAVVAVATTTTTITKEGADHHTNTNNNTNNTQSATIISALTLLQLWIDAPSTRRLFANQLLLLPHALHGLACLITDQSHNNVPIWQQALTLAKTLSTWPVVAKNWMFESVVHQLLQVLQTMQTDDNNNNDDDDDPHTLLLIKDVWSILDNLLQHDTSLIELAILQSHTQTRDLLAQCILVELDLRNKQQFRRRVIGQGQEETVPDKNVAGKDDINNGGDDDDDDSDDLDDLLQAGSKLHTKTTKSKTAATTTTASVSSRKRSIPYLTETEDDLILILLHILSTMADNAAVRNYLLTKPPETAASLPPPVTVMMTMVWEMGLLVRQLPNDVEYMCAMPSLKLQQATLMTLAKIYASPPDSDGDNESNEDLDGVYKQRLDRLLYLVCTGGSAVTTDDESTQLALEEPLTLSQSALHVIRVTLSSKCKTQLLLHGLAPSIEDEDAAATDGEHQRKNNNNKQGGQPVESTTIVSRLLNTVFEQVVVILEATSDDTESTTPQQKQPQQQPSSPLSNRSKVLLVGATSALTLFSYDDVSRTMLLRLTNEPSLMDKMLECCCRCSKKSAMAMDPLLSVTILRFVCHWIQDAPDVMERFLQSSFSSQALSVLLSSKQEPAVTTLATLLVGYTCRMMHSDKDHGGWTQGVLLQLVINKGIPNVLSQLEAVKSQTILWPWSLCPLEWKVWQEWYSGSVLMMRKQLIQHMTLATTDGDDDEIEATNVPVTRKGSNDAGGSGGSKSLQRVIAQQAQEIESLTKQLSQAQHTMSLQGKSSHSKGCQSVVVWSGVIGIILTSHAP